MAKSKAQKIWKGGKVVGYEAPTPDGGSIIVRGGQGKQGYRYHQAGQEKVSYSRRA